MQMKLQNILIKLKYVQWTHTEHTPAHTDTDTITHTHTHSGIYAGLRRTFVMPAPIVFCVFTFSRIYAFYFPLKMQLYFPRNRSIINYLQKLLAASSTGTLMLHTICIHTYVYTIYLHIGGHLQLI